MKCPYSTSMYCYCKFIQCKKCTLAEAEKKKEEEMKKDALV